MGSVNSMKKLGDIPYGSHLKRTIKDLKILLSEQPSLGKQVLDDIDALFGELKNKYSASTNGSLLSKRQYVAIVGSSQISEETIFEIARDYGLSKSNIKILGDFGQYQSGRYNELLKSDLCIGVIFGAVPHSARDNISHLVKGKSFLAMTKSKKLKLTKESLRKAIQEIV